MPESVSKPESALETVRLCDDAHLEAVRLCDDARLEAVFVPSAGMLSASLRHRRVEDPPAGRVIRCG